MGSEAMTKTIFVFNRYVCKLILFADYKTHNGLNRVRNQSENLDLKTKCNNSIALWAATHAARIGLQRSLYIVHTVFEHCIKQIVVYGFMVA